MKIKFIIRYILFTLYLLPVVCFAQNPDLAMERIQLLCSEKKHGRGYVKDGAAKSAEYLSSVFKKYEIEKFNNSYYQEFSYQVNSFPGKMRVRLNGKRLKPGVEYVVGPETPNLRGRYKMIVPDSTLLNDTIKIIQHLGRMDGRNDKLLVIDFENISNVDIRWFYVYLMRFNYLNFGGFVELHANELMWSVRRYQSDYPVVKLKKDVFPKNSRRLFINVEAELIDDFEAKNIIGYIPGDSDEFIVLTAHYDHLGRMGRKTLFPGAQDNASGVSMLLDFAEYYSKNKPKYSIAFMLFFGEEAGLLGSRHYVNNPLFNLDDIKLVINLDMVGTGDDGITIVNGKTEGYEEVFELVKSINNENDFLEEVAARGETANSDHFPFHQNGIKAIFIYTRGDGTYYHSIKDRPETLSLKGYNGLFNLLTNFIDSYE